MKHLLIASSFLLLLSCGKNTDHSQHDNGGAMDGEDPNKALYDQVMDIHDEVMSKGQAIYDFKMELLKKLENSPNLEASKKEALQQVIAELDSADHAMMDWMHNFSPLPDSTNQETTRDYLETEMEKIKKVQSLTNETLEKAKTIKENE